LFPLRDPPPPQPYPLSLHDALPISDVYVDHDPKGNPDIHLRCTVTVAGDRLKIDFTGSDARPEIQAYSSFGNTRGYVVAQLASRSEEHTSELQSRFDLVCRLLLEKK